MLQIWELNEELILDDQLILEPVWEECEFLDSRIYTEQNKSSEQMNDSLIAEK